MLLLSQPRRQARCRRRRAVRRNLLAQSGVRLEVKLPLLDLIGAPQISALLVLAQRGFEELYSARNTKALLAEGGREAGSAFYPVVAATHLAWIASLFFLISPDAITLWSLIGYYLVLQIVRYWVIGNPNYAITIIETFVLPLAFGALALAAIMPALWWTVLTYKIRLEDESLEARRSA